MRLLRHLRTDVGDPFWLERVGTSVVGPFKYDENILPLREGIIGDQSGYRISHTFPLWIVLKLGI